jgi:putative ABC transport system permease protein
MILLKRLRALFRLALRHILEQKWLTFATLIGLTTAIALVYAIPFYADAINYRILTEELSKQAASTSRSPFSFLFAAFPNQQGGYSWGQIASMEYYLATEGARTIGLDSEVFVHFYQTDNFRIHPPGTLNMDVPDPNRAWMAFGVLNDFFEHVAVEGEPSPAGQDSPEVPVWVGAAYAAKYGFQPGDVLVAYRTLIIEGEPVPVEIPIRVAGIWQPRDAADPYWYYNPAALDDVLVVADGEAFAGRVLPQLGSQVYNALWYFVMDGSGIHAETVDRLIRNITRIESRVDSIIPGSSLASSPAEALARYRDAVRELTFLLYVFSVPVVALLVSFVGLVVSQAIQNRQNEIAVMRSRGATVTHMLALVGMEGLILALAAAGIGLPAGLWFSRLIGQARSFLDFSLNVALRNDIGSNSLFVGLAAVALVVAFQILPVFEVARHTVVSYKRERARALAVPWWQRYGLDVFLLAPTLYGAYQLDRQGSLALGEGAASFDPWQNPLLLLIPALAIFSVTLFLVRLLPRLMAAVSWLLFRTNSVGVLMAVRQLARSARFYLAPLILLIMTLSLAIYTATLADTLDRALYDQEFYRTGSHLRLVELGANEDPNTPAAGGAAADEEGTIPYFFLPDWEHLEIEGVEAYTRVGSFEGYTNLGGGPMRGLFLGIDRVTFPQVAFWRDDFASHSLGGLMNLLALNPDGLIVDRGFLARNGLRAGDTVNVQVSMLENSAEIPLRVVAAVDYFPTWYPENENRKYTPLFVGNLDYLFQQFGGVFRYDIWLKADPASDFEAMALAANFKGLQVISWDAPLLRVRAEQVLPQRQGLFGVLSVGFLIAALLTVMGLFIYWIFSFRRRFVELGVLQAIGLSVRQLGAVLAWELGILTALGGGAGTLLGVAVSRFFIPFLQRQHGSEAIPPFLIDISWLPVMRVYLLFALLFLAALAALIILLRQMQIFQAIKLGETI